MLSFLHAPQQAVGRPEKGLVLECTALKDVFMYEAGAPAAEFAQKASDALSRCRQHGVSSATLAKYSIAALHALLPLATDLGEIAFKERPRSGEPEVLVKDVDAPLHMVRVPAASGILYTYRVIDTCLVTAHHAAGRAHETGTQLWRTLTRNVVVESNDSLVLLPRKADPTADWYDSTIRLLCLSTCLVSGAAIFPSSQIYAQLTSELEDLCIVLRQQLVAVSNLGLALAQGNVIVGKNAPHEVSQCGDLKHLATAGVSLFGVGSDVCASIRDEGIRSVHSEFLSEVAAIRDLVLTAHTAGNKTGHGGAAARAFTNTIKTLSEARRKDMGQVDLVHGLCPGMFASLDGDIYATLENTARAAAPCSYLLDVEKVVPDTHCQQRDCTPFGLRCRRLL